MRNRIIYLAGGCFWGVEGYFKKINGVLETAVGYANGKTETTTYQDLKNTLHAETVKIIYNSGVVSLKELLLHLFRIIDPESLNKQGNDVGVQYRTGIYYIDEADKNIIDDFMNYMRIKYKNLAVEVQRLENFCEAEDYHQDYLDKNPGGYCHVPLYLADEPLFTEDFAKKDLSDLNEEEKNIMFEKHTEKPFSSPLNKEYRKGIYVDKLTGAPLFASSDKFDSGCGWPAFSKPILSNKIKFQEDHSHGLNRIEVLTDDDHHLGHVFTDGIPEKGGLRYCINGAILDFIPYEEMEEKGYKEFMFLVE